MSMDRLFIFVLALGVQFSSNVNAEIRRKAENSRQDFFVSAKSFVRLYSSRDLKATQAEIDRAVIVVHGTLRNGDEYFENIVQAAEKAKALHRTVIISPSFKRSGDEKDVGELFWGTHWTQKWKYGYESQGSHDQISSFTVIDRLIEELSNRVSFPNLKDIVLTGHSAGGQFVQRYAVASNVDKRVRAAIHYAPSNPSSYLYLTPDRLAFDGSNFVHVDQPALDCKEYDHYIYGLTQRNNYLKQMSIEELRSNYISKRVTYFQGEEDLGTDYLDRSCEANLQGMNRYERGANYYMAAHRFLKATDHRFVSVPGVGHDNLKMFLSRQGQHLLFGTGTQAPYEYFQVGSNSGVHAKPQPLYMLMGGSTNVGPAFTEFLIAARGGDLVVLSAKKPVKQTYNLYFKRLAEFRGVALNSVKTLILNDRSASSDRFVLDVVRGAEAIFFTGGDQSRYINRIKGTELHKLIQERIKAGVPISGTSAGLAIMGRYIFDAKNDTTFSSEVLHNPFHSRISLTEGFLGLSFFKSVLTDTHFAERDRMGRLLVFMQRARSDFEIASMYGVGVNEATAIVVNDQGVGRLYGKSNAYIVQSNGPADVLKPGRPMTSSNMRVFKMNKSSRYDFKSMTGRSGERYVLDVEKGRVRSSSGAVY